MPAAARCVGAFASLPSTNRGKGILLGTRRIDGDNAIVGGVQWQVALPAYCTGGNYVTIHLFSDGKGLSLCPRGHSFYRDGTDMNVFCFAERDHAERFGGELIDPKVRPKWPGSRR